ncbi:hypothetical protein ACFPYM_18905, partial [Methylobacterium hispanicum]
GTRLCASVACRGASAENAAVAPTWSALKALGTDGLLGSTFSGTRVDAAALVAGARVIGPLEMDRVMRGATMDPGLASVVKTAMDSVSGTDIGSVTGRTGGIAAVAAAAETAAPGASGTSAMNADGDSPPGCDSRVSQMMVQASSKYVEDMDQIARSDMGFTRKDGKGAQPSYESEVGNKRPFQGGGSMGGLSCLSNLFSQARVLDNLFRPPTMQSLMNQVQNMTCGPALAAIGQVNQTINRAVFGTASMGGFYPGAFLNSMGGGLNGGGIGGINIQSLAGAAGGSGFGGPGYGGTGYGSNGGYAVLFGR